jgi:hypothetical protein
VCKEGWTGLNCNGAPPFCSDWFRREYESARTVCTSNKACSSLVAPPDASTSSLLTAAEEVADNGAICYKGGYAVKQIYQMCDVTSASGLHGLDGPC